MGKILRRRRADSGAYLGQEPGQESSLTVGSRRITSATNWGSWSSQYTSTSTKPQMLSIPRMRILLAPYMSPFVVPVHKVETWALLNETITALFGPGLAKETTIRITDHQGNSILPAVWQDLVEPDMTVIVDTGALQSGDGVAPAIFLKEEGEFYGSEVEGIAIGQALPMMPPSQPPGREVGGDGDTAKAAPVFRMSRKWDPRGVGEEEVHWHPPEPAATRYSGRPPPPTRDLPVPPVFADEKPARKGGEGGSGSERRGRKEMDWEQRRSRLLPSWSKPIPPPPTPKPKQKTKHTNSSFSRFAKTLMTILSPRPTLQKPKSPRSPTAGPIPRLVPKPNQKTKQGRKQRPKSSRHFPEPQGKILASAIENNPPRRIRAERGRQRPPQPQPQPPEPRRSVLASAIENNPPKQIRAKTISARRGAAPLPSIIPTSPLPPPAAAAAQPAKRSKSLPQLKDDATAALVTSISPPVSASLHVDKPLPKLPFKFSAFPLPVRSSPVMEGWQKSVFTEGKIPLLGT